MDGGDITFDVNLDTKEIKKQLKEAKKEVEKANNRKEKAEKKRDDANSELDKLTPELEEAKKKLENLKEEAEKLKEILENADPGKAVDPQKYIEAQERAEELTTEIEQQEKAVAEQQAEWDKAADKAEKAEEAVAKAEEELEAGNAAVAELEEQLEEAQKEEDGIADDAERAAEATREAAEEEEDAKDSADKWGKKLRSIAKTLLMWRMISPLFSQIKGYMRDLVTSNTEIQAEFAKTKAALATAFAPLWEAAVPVLTYILSLVTQIASAVASLVSALFGRTARESADAAKALEGERKALKGAGGAAKDAAKQIAGFDEINKLAGENAGGGGGGGSQNQMDFSFLDDVGGFLDAWENGIDWDNLKDMILGVALACGVLYLALGPVAAGIGLIVGGLALLATGFHDVSVNGVTLENTLTIIAGFLTTGLGISILTGSWIPLLITAILGIVYGFVALMGYGEEFVAGLELMFGGLIDFFTGVFTGDWDLALSGLGDILKGFGLVVASILESILAGWDKLMQWLDGVFATDWTWLFGSILGKPINAFFRNLKDTFSGIRTIFSGLVDIVKGLIEGDWTRVWHGAANVVIGIVNIIISVLNGLIDSFFGAIQVILDIANGIGQKLGFTMALTVTAPHIPAIPALANGAVIPPNAPFMAMLGDQTHGNNIETPEALLRKVVREESGGGDTDLMKEQNELLRQILARSGVWIDGRELASTVTAYQRKNTRAMG